MKAKKVQKPKQRDFNILLCCKREINLQTRCSSPTKKYSRKEKHKGKKYE